MKNPAAAKVLLCAVEGLTLTREERDFFAKYEPAGLTVFSRNVPTPYTDLSRWTQELQNLRSQASPPFLIAIDQEGGRVARIKASHASEGIAPFPEKGPPLNLENGLCTLGAVNNIARYANEMGLALKKLGIHANFAPCCDVLTLEEEEEEKSPIGDRAFERDPYAVGIRAEAFLFGLKEAGILGCLKHFPGIGDATVDPHHATTTINRSLQDLGGCELIPFRSLVSEAPMVMMSHCIYPELAPVEATRSPLIIRALLRGSLDFKGVVVSDDMNMSAIPQGDKDWEKALVESVAAGVDLLLICRHIERAIRAQEALTAAAARSRSFAERLEEAAERVTNLRRTL